MCGKADSSSSVVLVFEKQMPFSKVLLEKLEGPSKQLVSYTEKRAILTHKRIFLEGKEKILHSRSPFAS